MDEHLAPVMKRAAFTGWWDASRERLTEPQPIGKSPKSVQSDVAHDTGPAGFHNDATSAGTVHFGSALLVGISVV